MDYKNVFDKMEDERRLLQFVSELILNKTRFNDIDIVYDQITNDFVNNLVLFNISSDTNCNSLLSSSILSNTFL
jgi:hypothetical protein